MAKSGSRRRSGRLLSVVVTVVMAAALLGVGGYLVERRSAGATAAPAALSGSALLDAAASSSAQWDSKTFQLVRPGGHGPATAGLPIPAAPAPTAPAAQPAAPQASGQRPAAAPAAPAGGTLPLAVSTGSSTQVITVVAPSSGSTTARVTAWQRSGSGWTAVVGPVPAMIGQDGVGRASEQTSRTPAGTFTLTEAFGRQADPGTGLPYRTINANDYWVSDTASAKYNQFAECAPGTCPFNTSAGEHLWDAGGSYNYAVVIDYNRWPATPGAGSAFFLHVTNGAPTAGCVATDQGSLLRIMQWLDPAAHPLIAIGVG